MSGHPRNERGQGLVEYAFILILVAMIVLVVLVVFGAAVGNMFSNVVSGI
jgi:pilus assembly protein Flp/PilA